MKFGLLIEHKKRNIFFQKSWRKYGRETSSRKKAFYEVKAIYSLVSIYFDLACNKNKLYKTLDYLSRDMLIFPPHFVHDFSKKIFIMLYSINRSNFIVWLLMLLDIFGKMCIAIVCFPGCDVITFEINLIVLIKPFYYMTKKSRQKFKYLENEKSFQGEIKSIFHHL